VIVTVILKLTAHGNRYCANHSPQNEETSSVAARFSSVWHRPKRRMVTGIFCALSARASSRDGDADSIMAVLFMFYLTGSTTPKQLDLQCWFPGLLKRNGGIA
jgi:hypothetical protein